MKNGAPCQYQASAYRSTEPLRTASKLGAPAKKRTDFTILEGSKERRGTGTRERDVRRMASR